MGQMQIIAFLGMGKMGQPMACNLASSGFKVRCWNRTTGKLHSLPSILECKHDINTAVAGSDVVISMLSDGAATQNVINSLDRNALTSVKAWIEMASILPEEATTQEKFFKKNDTEYLDAPVSGGTAAANDGNLAIMVGGEEKVFLETKKILGAMGRPVLVGPTGAGQLAKLANQAIVGITISAVAEAVLLLERGGANLDSVRDALSGGFADSAILQQHGQRMSKRNFESGGSVRTQLKDLQNIQKVAQISGLELPMVNKVTERYSALCANSLNLEKDHSALFLELLDRNKITD
jgi:2-hydroxy-3-oxopropionate reductase